MLRAIFVVPLISASLLLQEINDENFGIVETHPKTTAEHFSTAYPALQDASEGNQVFLWKYLEKAMGTPVVPHKQDNEGDCVAQAFGMGVDLLTATEIHMLRENERWVAEASIEMIYAGSRVEIGGGEIRGSDGSVGEWGALYLQTYGVLHQIKYENYDLTGYSAARSRQYRDIGVPDELEPIAREHPVKKYTTVADFDEACDALAGGQPIVICCSYAPVLDRNGVAHRDRNGFIKLETGKQCCRWHRNQRKKWYHAWCVIGYDKQSADPGLFIINSHGPDWIDGPRPFDIPEGSFKLSPEHANLMIKDWGTTYAISAYVGHPGTRPDELKKQHRLYL